MAGGIPARLNRAEGRRFGFVVGTAFLVLGYLFWWRGRLVIGQALGAMGAAMIFWAAVLPNALARVHRIWMRAALVISKVTSPIFIAIVYFAIITPIGIARRLFGRDPLRGRRPASSLWVARNEHGRRQSSMERQF